MRRFALMTTAALGVAMMPLGAAEAQTPFDWAGLYFGVHGGYLTGDVSIVDGGVAVGTISGFIGGGLAGYNFQPTGPFVFGVEADFGIGSVDGTGQVSVTEDEVQDIYSYDLNWNKHIRARVGMPVGHIMPFVAGGLAIADFDVSENRAVMAGGVFVGGTIGAGVDAKLGPNLVGRGELLYDMYGKKTYDDCTVSFDTLTVRVAAIVRLP